MSGKNELTDQEFVENIVKTIVDHPEEVMTARTLDERGVLIQLTVNREDMGKVIGREGRTAKAIRTLLRVFGARNESRINLKIVDPEGEAVAIPEESSANSFRSDSGTKAVPKELNLPVVATQKTVEVEKTDTPAPKEEEKATGVI